MQWTAVSSRRPARAASVRASGLATLLLAQHAAAAAVDYSHIIPVSDSALNSSASSQKLHGRFLHITDMHPDMFYKAHTSTSESIACHRGKGPAGYYGAETSDCDSPVQLVDSALTWIKENIKDEIDFVIWTGDSARHDSDEEIPRNASQVLGTNKLMVKKMLEVFSDEHGKLEVPIIPSLGNNDILPHNILLPAPNKWLRTYTDVWKHFIPESQLHFFDNGGWFYTEVIPNKLAVFSVNTLYFFDRNAGVDDCERPSEPGFKQMEWLRIQLQELRRRGVKAILTGHVPPARTPGKQNWDETCWQKYNLWVTQFRDVIVGTIYGHMNIDHFLLHDSNDIDIQQMAFGFDEPEATSEPILHDQSASISASANYLVDLRQLWSKLPDPRASARITEDETAEFTLSKSKPWKGIGNKYGERYHLSLVSPSIVPNYFPTIRVISYNTEGLDAPLWRDAGEPSIAQTRAFHRLESVNLDNIEDETADALARKKKHNKKKGDKKHKDPNLIIPEPPTKGSPPGPAYSMQPLTFTGYTQYYANLTNLNNNIKVEQDDVADGHMLELRSVDDDEFDAEWRSGPHKGKKLHKDPKHKPFAFEVEYSTFTNKVYKLKDLTVKSYLKFAYRMGQRKKGRGLFTLEEDDQQKVLADVADSEYDVENDNDLDDDEDFESDEEDVQDLGKKKKKKKKKGKKSKKNKPWRQFLEFAFVKTLDKKKIDGMDE